MTAEAIEAPEATGDDRLRARALDTIKTATLEAILLSDEPLRTVDAARLVAERLELELTEEEMGGLASLVRMVLDSDPLFSQSNRQWDLALRMGRAEGDRRKPVERAVEDFIDLLGHPSESYPVAVLVAAVYGRTTDYYEKMIERLADTRPQFFRARGKQIGITRWLLDISSDDPDDVEYDNFDDLSAVEVLRSAAKGLDGGDAIAYARTLVSRAGQPVDGRALQFVTWCAHPDTDPRTLFTGLYRDQAVSLERGPSWVTAEEHAEVLETVRAMSRDPQAASEIVAAVAPVEEEEIVSTGILAPTVVRVSDDDLDQVYDFMRGDERTHRLSELLQQVLEAFPGSRTYVAIRESLQTRMQEDPRFVWLGFERYRLDGQIPVEVQVLPEGLAFDEVERLNEEGEAIDRPVDPREWKFALDEQIQHYLVQEVGDDATAPGTTPSRLEASAPLHHYVAGTYYLRNSDRGLFPSTPDILQVSLAADDDNRVDVWVNNRLGLIFAMKEWYEANLPWVGGRFVIERTDIADEYRLIYGGETEPLMDIPLPRLQELLQLRSEAATGNLALSEILLRILKAHPDGIHFVTLFAEVNIVRRVRRAQVASVLSAQRYFSQPPQQPGLWHFDEKRAAKGKKKGPKRPMREMYEEGEDEELEFE
jgi:hypothetical protein